MTSVPNATALDNFCYQYRYDGKKRLIEKKIPGKGWEYMVYNTLDQLVLRQDALQRAANQWLFNKYDVHGRTVISGLYNNNATRASLQGTINGQTTLWEGRDNTNSSATNTGYTNSTIPIVSIAANHTISYYDDYNFYGNSFIQPTGSTQIPAGRTKGLATGGWVYKLGSTDRYLSVNFYDEEGRVVQIKSQNHLAGTDVTDNTYNFAGELVYNNRTHTANSAITTIATRYEYDHMGRKKATMESINGQTEVVLSKLDYNEVGQLAKKSVHSTDGTTFLQNTKLGYNERGWLKRSISDQFSMKLGYDTLSNAQYNGNIASQQWGSGSSFPNVFTYGYDKLNRLLNGTVMSEVLTYDIMGNIKTLNRDGAGIGTYNYTGNRLTSITGGGLAAGAYVYDANGNATTDGRTGVALTYNYLNLPLSAVGGGINLAYTYDATGNKLKKISNIEATSDYVAGIQYTGGALDFVMTEEGKARNNGGVYRYEYNLTDHLGNVRYSFYKHPVTGALTRLQSDDYYAFGKRLSGSPISLDNKYLYNGKELQTELGQLDYGARFYDPVIGRWNVVDPLADEFDYMSPYNYAMNNPVLMIDPDGMAADTGGKASLVVPPPITIVLKEVVINAAKSVYNTATAGLGYLATGISAGGAAVTGTIASIFLPSNFHQEWQHRDYGLPPLPPPYIPIHNNKNDDDKSNQSVNYEIGEKLPTPLTNPGEFSKRKGNQGWVRNKTGEIYKKSHTSHGNKNNEGDQWKVWPKGTNDNSMGNNSKKSGDRTTLDQNGKVIGN